MIAVLCIVLLLHFPDASPCGPELKNWLKLQSWMDWWNNKTGKKQSETPKDPQSESPKNPQGETEKDPQQEPEGSESNEPSKFIEDIATFKKEMLDEHNKHRKMHNDDGQNYDLSDARGDLNGYAKQLAEHLAKNGPDGVLDLCKKCGVSVLRIKTGEITAKRVTDTWYAESANYDFNSPEFFGPKFKSCEHFTQMVWLETESVGFDRVTAEDGSAYIVGYYYPAGNHGYSGIFKDNVKRKKEN